MGTLVRPGPPVRGRVAAVGFVIDPALVGEREARRRVMAAWSPGSRLCELPDAAWLLVLPAPVSIRAEHAPGQVATESRPGRLTVWRHGMPLEPDLDRLAPVDMAGWVDLAGLPVHVLEPVEGAQATVMALAPAPQRLGDLRQVTGLAAVEGPARRAGLLGGLLPQSRSRSQGQSRRRGRATRTVSRPPGSGSALVRVLGLLVAIGLAFAAFQVMSGPNPDAGARPLPAPTGTAPEMAPTEAAPGPQTPPYLLAGVLTIVALGLALGIRSRSGSGPAGRTGAAGRAREAGEAARPGQPRGVPTGRRDLVSRLLVSPLGGVLRRRHERYLLGLARAFDRSDFDSALRQAIALGGGAASAGLTVRLPRPRLGALVPSPTLPGATPSLATPLNAYAYLRELYEQAASHLEHLDRIDEAAFVRADLMGAPLDAVRLLERHGRRVLAAELADGRLLDPALVVRLWWQAGRRDRAIDVARVRGGLDGAARQLDDVDPEAALLLRRQWVQQLLVAGAVVTAVRIAWPFPPLREVVLPHLVLGAAIGGTEGAVLLAHLVTAHPDERMVAEAEGLLGSEDDDARPARSAFVTTLAELDGEHAASDRRLASAALRAITADDALLADHAASRATQITRALERRAGDILAADIAPFGRSRTPRPAGSWTITASAEQGVYRLRDAVALPTGVLVALGAAGVRLLTPAGRVKAHWHVPADRLVVADHGHGALLLVHGEQLVEAYRLDLRTGRLRRWACLPRVLVADTFDGSILPVVDPDGLALLDVIGTAGDTPAAVDRPRTVWREFERGVSVLGLGRRADRLSALVSGAAIGLDGRPQLWTWSIPGMTLRARRPLDLAIQTSGPITSLAVGAGTGLLVLHGEAARPLLQWHPADYQPARELDATHVVGVTAAGPHLALRLAGSQGQAVNVLTPDSPESHPALRVVVPDADDLRLRHHGPVITVLDTAGRVVAADVGTHRVVANLTVRG